MNNKWRHQLKVNSNSVLYMLFLIVIPLVFSSISSIWLIQNSEELQYFDLGNWILFYGITVFTMAFAFTPTTYISLVSGYFLGMQSVLFVIPSYLLASIVGYFVAQIVDHGRILNSVSSNPKVERFLTHLKRREFLFVILSRLSPVLPFAFMNFALSAIQTRFKVFLVAGFIGMLPRTLLFIWVGTQGNDISNMLKHPNQELGVKMVVIGLVIFSVLGMISIINKSIAKSEDS